MTDATAKSTASAPATTPRPRKVPVAKKLATAAKPVVKKATQPAPKSAVKPAVVAKKKVMAKPAKPVTAPKPAKIKKPKMVRDSMTMPKAEYAVLAELKLRAAKLARPVKKTELLRAGIKALAGMSDASFLVALKAVPSLKTGRPSKT